MRTHAIAALVLFVHTGAQAQPEPLTLKGYRIGQAMAACPQETARQELQRDGQTWCFLAGQTFAGHAAQQVLVAHHEGMVSSVGVVIDPSAAGDALHALTAAWGAPTSKNLVLQTYEWRRGRHWLGLNKLRGTVSLIDPWNQEQRNRALGEKTKPDV